MAGSSLMIMKPTLTLFLSSVGRLRGGRRVKEKQTHKATNWSHKWHTDVGVGRMGSLISNVIEEIAKDKGMDILFQNTSKKKIYCDCFH